VLSPIPAASRFTALPGAQVHRVADVDLVIRHLEWPKTIIAGHDSRGSIGWHYPMAYPDRTVIGPSL
jgi:pimeloyl-ACP methyl ester carboxylesterase